MISINVSDKYLIQLKIINQKLSFYTYRNKCDTFVAKDMIERITFALNQVFKILIV